MNCKILGYSLAAVAAVSMPITDLLAQTEIEEVVVTARKREESLQEVPISIAAFSADEIRIRSVTNMKDLGMMTPNLSWAQHSSGGASVGLLFIRGVGQSDKRTFWDPGVGMYIDGIYVARSQAFDIDIMGVERVEVLRGPQGTLFGKNTIGGAINIVSKRPGDEFSAEIGATTGSYDRIDVTGRVEIPLVPGKLSASIAAASRNRDGYTDRLDYVTKEVVDHGDDVNRDAFRSMLNWTPAENFRALLIADVSRVREKSVVQKMAAFNTNAGLAKLLNIFADPPYGDNFLTDSNYTSYATGGNTRDLDDWGLSLRAEWDLSGDYRVVSITGYRDMESLNDIEPDGTPYSILNNRNPVNQDQFTQEVQLHGIAFDRKLEWVTGLYYFREQGDEEEFLDVYTELATYPPIPGTPLPLDAGFIRNWEFDNKSFAVFGQGTFQLSDKLSFTGGLRYTWEKKVLGRDQVRWNLSNNVVVPWQEASESWNDLSGMASLQYQWNDDVMTYVSASRGFKSGGHNGTSANTNDFIPFDPEYIWTYEAGVKSDLLDHRLRFNATVFYSDYTDMQFVVVRAGTLGEPVRTVGNAAAAEVKGFEVEVLAVPSEGLTLQAGIGYTDAAYTKVEPTTGLTTDTKFNSVPKWSGMLSAQYEMPLSGWGSVTPRVDYAFRGKTNFDTFNSPFLWQDAYGLLNARLTFKPGEGNWSVALFGTNLADKEYILGGTDLFANIGVAGQEYARRREWGLSVNFDF